MQKRFLLLQEVCIEKTLFNQAFLIYVDCNGQGEDELLLGLASLTSKMKRFKTSSKLGQLHLQVMKNQNSLEAST